MLLCLSLYYGGLIVIDRVNFCLMNIIDSLYLFKMFVRFSLLVM